jgi:hypothetical protein
MQIDVISLLSALGVILLGLLQWRNTSRTTHADGNAVDLASFHNLVNKVEAQAEALVNVRKLIVEIEVKNRALWHYVYELLEFIIVKGMTPPLPPVELESDPKLSRLLSKVKS